MIDLTVDEAKLDRAVKKAPPLTQRDVCRSDPARRATTRSINSPETAPGQSALTRTPAGPISRATVSVSPITANLVAQ